MNEIPKNAQGPSIPQQPQVQKVEQVKQESVENTASNAPEVQSKGINEIPENPADRSAVKVDNLENDLKIFASNPELAKQALDIAELAELRYERAGLEDPEMKALAVGKAFVEEFQK